MKQGKDGEAVPVVIGWMVLDIQATSSIPPHPRTTCPGQVHYVQGGVARNIAECMGKLGADPFFISVLGFDMAGTLLMEHWKSVKLPTEGIRRQQDIKTPTVCHLLDVTGEVAAGVASVEAVEKFITPEWIQQFKRMIRSAPILMVDANLSPTLEASCRLAAESNIPVWFEPISIAKSKRIAPIVKYISFASPNEDELIAMANALSSGNLFSPIEKHKCSSDTLFQMLKPAIWLLLQKGVKVLVLTIGSDGVILCTKGEPNSRIIGLEKSQRHGFSQQLFETMTSSSPSNRYFDSKVPERSSNFLAVHFPALSASVVRLTGAGDCLVGGMLASLSAGLDVMQSVAIGIAAAKTSVEVDSNVPSQFSLETITGDARIVYSAAKVMQHKSKL
ncbi:pseudouridine kinase-like [Hibiscus syriacus]|uniref:pseudouridine kinase-like n=1 Tax=Hibiscus syriacus TaxID=106335 RepID=UPI001920E951|nr:pseudouridine kinase-like [Hibiscus syriacus]